MPQRIRAGKTEPASKPVRVSSRTPDNLLLELQRSHGNAYVQRLIQREVIGVEADVVAAKAVPAAWDYDPGGLLGDPALNPQFVAAAKAGLKAAADAGMRPKVHEAYRSAERSDELYEKWKKGTGGRAAPGWSSTHNYGLGMDVYLYDEKGTFITTPMKGWYKQYKQLAAHLVPQKLVWGEPINDAVHFEYHPAWPGLADGSKLESTRTWALSMVDAAFAEGETDPNVWLQFFWYAAGAGGRAPVSTPSSGPHSGTLPPLP